MAAKNRADLIANLFKVLKKEYQPVLPPSNRTVIENAIYGCCLENSTYEGADEAFAKLHEYYFDWNEVRVTTTAELAQTMKSLSYPMQAAERLKKLLYGIFETYYQFDLEFLKKENLSKAVIQFEKMVGVSPYTISFMSQNGLNGHSIPTDRCLLELMVLIGVITEEEAKKGRVPGLERAIPKAKGVEFGSLAHQLAVAFHSAPFSTNTRNIILKIAPDAKERFPKRGGKAKAQPAEKKAVKKAPAEKVPAEKAAAQETTVKKAAVKKAAVKKPAAKKAAAKKAPAKKSTKKAASKKAATKKAPVKKAPEKKAKKKSAKSLAKKKPR